MTAFYPLQFLSERVGGDAVTVTNLTKPGAEPHDLELNPRQVGRRSATPAWSSTSRASSPRSTRRSRRRRRTGPFDAGSVRAAAGRRRATATRTAPGERARRGGPARTRTSGSTRSGFATIADQLAERLGQADPAHAADYTARAAALHAELTALDTEYATGLRTCAAPRDRHQPHRVRLPRRPLRADQVGITGISPEAEPSPQRLAEVAEQAQVHRRHHDLLRDPGQPEGRRDHRPRGRRQDRRARSRSKGSPSRARDYFSVMRANLTALPTALGCTS